MSTVKTRVHPRPNSSHLLTFLSSISSLCFLPYPLCAYLLTFPPSILPHCALPYALCVIPFPPFRAFDLSGFRDNLFCMEKCTLCLSFSATLRLRAKMLCSHQQNTFNTKARNWENTKKDTLFVASQHHSNNGSASPLSLISLICETCRYSIDRSSKQDRQD